MANFVITQSKNGEFRFILKADNGQVILNSEGYSSKAAALKGLGSVITNSQSKNNFEQKKANNGKFYFNLKAANGRIIGTSQMYDSEDGMINGLASVLKNAHNAGRTDETV